MSMCSGRSNIQHLISNVGIRLCVHVSAERESDLQRAVPGEHGVSAGEWRWGPDNNGVPTFYVSDVWNPFEKARGHAAIMIREAVSLAAQPSHKYVIIGGSPCPQCATAGRHKGLLGLSGPQSVYYHVSMVIIPIVRALESEAQISIASETQPRCRVYAGSTCAMLSRCP